MSETRQTCANGIESFLLHIKLTLRGSSGGGTMKHVLPSPAERGRPAKMDDEGSAGLFNESAFRFECRA